MSEQTNLLKRITARPDVFGGKPIIRDMRISVELVLSLLAQGVTPEAILDDYPDLEPDCRHWPGGRFCRLSLPDFRIPHPIAGRVVTGKIGLRASGGKGFADRS